MPVPVQSGSLVSSAGIVYYGATASEFTVSVADSSDVLLGTLEVVAGPDAYTQGATGSSPLDVVKIKLVLDAGGSFGFAMSDTIEIEFDSALVVEVPLFPGFPDDTWVYIDRRGTLFLDELYEDIWDGEGIITTMIPIVTDEAWADDSGETADSLFIQEDTEADDVSDELAESISITSAEVLETEAGSDETLSVTDKTMVDSITETADIVLALDSIYEEPEIYYTDNLPLLDEGFIAVDVSDESLNLIDYNLSDFTKVSAPSVHFQIPEYPMDNIILGTISDDITDSRFFRFGPFDFGTTSLKHLANIELATKSDGDIYVCVEYQYDQSTTYKTSRFVKLSKKGFVHIPITAVNFRIIVITMGKELLKFDYLKLAHKFVDRSNTRGI